MTEALLIGVTLLSVSWALIATWRWRTIRRDREDAERTLQMLGAAFQAFVQRDHEEVDDSVLESETIE